MVRLGPRARSMRTIGKEVVVWQGDVWWFALFGKYYQVESVFSSSDIIDDRLTPRRNRSL